MAKVPIKTIEELRKKILPLKQEYEETFTPFKTILNEYLEKTNSLDESFSGSWIGFHSKLYYKNFQKPSWQKAFNIEWGSVNGIPDEWQEKTYEQVVHFIETDSSKKSLSEIENLIDNVIEHAEELKTSILTELSGIHDDKKFENEEQLMDRLRELKWGTSAQKFISMKQPGQTMTRDSYAASQGVKIPPHIKYEATILCAISCIESLDEFIKLSESLIRQIEIKQGIEEDAGSASSLSYVTDLCNRFPLVARQLQSRYNGRPTIAIEDEYDVQDLLHALLKMKFQDIRTEEWTPSYAGGALRMDFLLKSEKIVIEVKKTRKGLGEKELGEQLIIDIAKYKHHQDCKTLVCFVYDPELRIGNPTGIENDLMQNSDDEMNVVVLIKPQ